MKARLSLTLLAFIAVLGFTVHAASSNTAAPPAKKVAVRGAAGIGVAATSNPATSGLLVEAYHHLEDADHDYKGHRIHAMRQIETAARLLGVNLHGDGHVREAQTVSDEHLHTAQSLLQQASGGLAGKPLRHVRAALSQLNIALGIK